MRQVAKMLTQPRPARLRRRLGLIRGDPHGSPLMFCSFSALRPQEFNICAPQDATMGAHI